MTSPSELDTPTGRRPARCGRCAGSLLSLAMTVAVLGSLFIVPGSAADAQTDDTPANEPAPEDGSVDDSPAANEPAPEDGSVDDSPAANEPAPEDGSVDDSPAANEPAPEDGSVDDSPAANEPAPDTTGDPACTRPPADDDASGAAGLNDWCIHSEEWITETVCGPAFVGEARAVRYNAGPPTPAWILPYDLCGYEERVTDCPPAVSETASSETGEAATDAGADTSPATSDESAEEAAPTPTAETDAGADTSPATSDESAEEAAPTPTAETSALSPSAACGEPWPPGTWYESSHVDPIHRSPSAVGQLSGAWLGARDHRTPSTPTFVMNCRAGVLSVTVRTGGSVFAGYGRGVPVEYRIAKTTFFQEWQEVAATESRSTGVLVPPWLLADFVTLLADSPRGEFVIRVFGNDGAAVGTAAFDLAGIGMITEPVRATCDS